AVRGRSKPRRRSASTRPPRDEAETTGRAEGLFVFFPFFPLNAQRCPTGVITMPLSRGTVHRPQKGPLNLKGTTRVALAAISLSERTQYRGLKYLPGQRLVVDPLDAPELVGARKIQVIDDLPSTRWWD